MSAFALQYARALAEVVISDKLDTGQIDRQLGDFRATLHGSRELREVFSNPAIALDSKLKVLDAIALQIGMARQVRNFFAVLLRNDRIHALDSILSEYRDQINRRMHVNPVVVTSFRELTPEEKAGMEARAAAIAGGDVRAHYRQDPSLLGGVVLRIGDTVYDGSVRGRLEELREKLLAESTK